MFAILRTFPYWKLLEHTQHSQKMLRNTQQMLEMALVENIQRSNLNPIEVALSYQRLMEECKLTQEQCSERVGKKRSTIANFLRLLKLPEEIQASLQNSTISKGHARALINVKDKETQISIFNDTGGNITITQGSGVTLRLVATSTTGSRTLATYGLATLLCVGGDAGGGNEFVVSGGGVS